MEDVTSWVETLHRVVDDLARPIADAHGDRLRCRAGCASCCVDELTVFEIEADVIARHHGALLEEAAPAPEGGCAFLDASGACRVYAQRPYVCRTQGLPLRWLEQDAAPEDSGPGSVETETETFEVRDICALNADGEPLEELAPEACWTLGPFEARLAAMQRSTDGGRGRRVALRDLFARSSDAPRRRRLPLASDPHER